VSVDVVCAGRAFLDLTFAGLPEIPAPGSERFGEELHATPGGSATTAVGLARLGLRVALLAPIGRDLAGALLREALEREGVLCAGADVERTPVTVVLPAHGDRAMVSYMPTAEVDANALARLAPRAVVVDVESVGAAPDGAWVYAGVGDAEAERYAGALPASLARTRAVVANRSEAERLTGASTPEEAVRALAARAPAAVVSCGPRGAVAAEDGSVVAAPAPAVEVVDTTGAGDLLLAGYVFADLAGLQLAERLRHAVTYASLSVAKPTGFDGAATLAELRVALDR
jgi:sugar/nucleoside kinase (ribokinase family)